MRQIVAACWTAKREEAGRGGEGRVREAEGGEKGRSFEIVKKKGKGMAETRYIAA